MSGTFLSLAWVAVAEASEQSVLVHRVVSSSHGPACAGHPPASTEWNDLGRSPLADHVRTRQMLGFLATMEAAKEAGMWDLVRRRSHPTRGGLSLTSDRTLIQIDYVHRRRFGIMLGSGL
jgi:hypothetical protein